MNQTNIPSKLRVAIAFLALLAHQVLFGVLWIINVIVEWLMDRVEEFGTKVHNWALQNESMKETK